MQPISTTNLYELRYFLTERDTHPAHFLRGCEVALWPNKQSQEAAKNLPQIYPFRRYMTCSKMPVRSTISEDSSHLRCLFLLRSLSPSPSLSEPDKLLEEKHCQQALEFSEALILLSQERVSYRSTSPGALRGKKSPLCFHFLSLY